PRRAALRTCSLNGVLDRLEVREAEVHGDLADHPRRAARVLGRIEPRLAPFRGARRVTPLVLGRPAGVAAGGGGRGRLGGDVLEVAGGARAVLFRRVGGAGALRGNRWHGAVAHHRFLSASPRSVLTDEGCQRGDRARPCSTAPLTPASSALRRWRATASAEAKRPPEACSAPWWQSTQCSSSRRRSGSSDAGACAATMRRPSSTWPSIVPSRLRSISAP